MSLSVTRCRSTSSRQASRASTSSKSGTLERSRSSNSHHAGATSRQLAQLSKQSLRPHQISRSRVSTCHSTFYECLDATTERWRNSTSGGWSPSGVEGQSLGGGWGAHSHILSDFGTDLVLATHFVCPIKHTQQLIEFYSMSMTC